MCRLLAADKGRDLGFEPRIGRLAEIMLKKNIFGRDRNIGFQFEDEMPILRAARSTMLALHGKPPRRFGQAPNPPWRHPP